MNLLEGAMNALENCLAVKPGTRVTIAHTPLSTCCQSLDSAESILWWYPIVCDFNLQESVGLQKAVKGLMEQRCNIESALLEACVKIGATVKFVGIDTTEYLNRDFNWIDLRKAKQIRDELMNNTDVLIDLTLFGLDELPPTKRPYWCLRDEILAKNKQIRGADLHLVSESSFAEGGAMRAKYREIAEKVTVFAKLIKEARTIRILAGHGKEFDTDVTIERIDREKVYEATGMLQGIKTSQSNNIDLSIDKSVKKGEGFRRWHFLPSGAVFLALESNYRLEQAEKNSSGAGAPRRGIPSAGVKRHSRITFDGPSFGFGSFSKYPLVVEIGSDGRIDSDSYSLSSEAPYFQLVKKMFKEYPEAREIGELFIGLNPHLNASKPDPMEFEVAEGNISLALGRNDHMGGTIFPTNPSRSLHVHASISEATMHVDRLCVIKDGKLTDDFRKKVENWVHDRQRRKKDV
jgi:hypothetical protein